MIKKAVKKKGSERSPFPHVIYLLGVVLEGPPALCAVSAADVGGRDQFASTDCGVVGVSAEHGEGHSRLLHPPGVPVAVEQVAALVVDVVILDVVELPEDVVVVGPVALALVRPHLCGARVDNRL